MPDALRPWRQGIAGKLPRRGIQGARRRSVRRGNHPGLRSLLQRTRGSDPSDRVVLAREGTAPPGLVTLGCHRLMLGESTAPAKQLRLIFVLVIVAGADLDHAGVAKVDAAGMTGIGHQRTSATLDAGTTQRLAGVHGLPGGGAIAAREEAACAQPDEERAVRILCEAVHASAGEAGACWRESLPAVERANHLPEARAGVDHLRITPIHEQRAEASQLSETLQRLPAVGRLEQAGAAAVGAQVEHVG